MRKWAIFSFAFFFISVLFISGVYAQDFSAYERSFSSLSKTERDKIQIELIDEFAKQNYQELIPTIVSVTRWDKQNLDRIAEQFSGRNVEYFLDSSIIVHLNYNEFISLSRDKDVVGLDYLLTSYPLVLQDAVNIHKAVDTWNFQVGDLPLDGTNVTVCLLDSGVNFSHPDLVHTNIYGVNFKCKLNPVRCEPADEDYVPTNLHGTGVAGDLAANGGILGIGKGLNIISFDVMCTQDSVCSSFVSKAIQWCIQNREEYNIVAISTAYASSAVYTPETCPTTDPTFKNAIADANAVGISINNGAGNGGLYGVSNPACRPGIIAVGGIQKNGNLSLVSNYYPNLSRVFGVSNQVNSTFWTGGYFTSGGTSHSSQMIGAGSAIINQYLRLSGKPTFNSSQMEELMFNSGILIPNLPFDTYRTLDIYNAILSLDDIPPTIEIDYEEFYSTTEISVGLNIKDDLKIGNCSYSLNGGAFQNLDCSATLLSLNTVGGENVLVVNATDLVGNQASEQVTFSIDLEAPEISVEVNEFYNSTEVVLNILITDNYALDFCSYKLNNGEETEFDCSLTELEIFASEGQNTFRVSALDLAGNLENTSFEFIVDTELPYVEILYDEIYNYNPVTLGLVLGDNYALDFCSYKLNNGEETEFDCSLTELELTAFEGQNFLNVYVRDLAGNLGFGEVEFFVDSFIPVVSLTSEEVYASGELSLGLSIEENHGLEYCWSNLNGGEDVKIDCSATELEIFASEGQNTFRVSALDLAGNIGYDEVEFFVDSFIPVVSLTSEEVYASGELSLGLSIEENHGLEYCWSNLNGGEDVKIDCSATELEIFASEGQNTFRVSALDLAGNIGYDEVEFFVDLEAPSVQIFLEEIYNNFQINVPFDAQDNYALDFCSYKLNNGEETEFDCSAVEFNIQANTGINNLVVLVRDKVGLISQTNASFFVDMTAPVINIHNFRPLNYVQDRRISVNYSIADNYGLDYCWYNVNGGQNYSISCDENIFNYSLQTIENNFVVSALDLAGNLKSNNFKIIYRQSNLSLMSTSNTSF